MILTLIKKDLKIFFADKRGVFLSFLLPILLISLFAFAFGGIGGDSGQSNPIELLVADNDNSEKSKQLLKKLNALEVVDLVTSDEAKGEELVKKGKNVALLIIEDGFAETWIKGQRLPIELKYDASREVESIMLQSILNQEIMKDFGENVMKVNIENYLDSKFPGGDSEMKKQILTDISSESSNQNTIQLKTTSIIKEDKNTANFGLIQAVAGTAIMMLLFSIAAIGGSLIDEKEAGTFKRLLYAPVKPMDIIFGKMGIALFLAILQLVVMFLFAWLALGLAIFDDIISLSLLILVISFTVASFGIFLAAISKTRKQLEGLSTIIILVMSAIGGSMIPLFVMPAIMQKIAVISVNYWGIQGFYDIFARHLPLIEILPKMGVLLTIGIVMTSVSIYLFKRSLLKLA